MSIYPFLNPGLHPLQGFIQCEGEISDGREVRSGQGIAVFPTGGDGGISHRLLQPHMVKVIHQLHAFPLVRVQYMGVMSMNFFTSDTEFVYRR